MAYEAERRILETGQTLKRQVRDRVTAYVKAKWYALESWRDADIDKFVAEIVPQVMMGRTQVSQLTVATLDALSRQLGFVPPPVPGVDLAAIRQGIDPDEQYRRSGKVVWTALSERKHLNEAVRLGWLRNEQMLALDMQLAHTHTARAWMQNNQHVVGYRRVLTGFENCALCALASTQRYHKANLLEIHDHCDCQVAPILGDFDPGQVIDEEMYGRVMSQLTDEKGTYGGRTVASKWESSNKPNSHLRVHMNGETGPTLYWSDHNFTGPSDLA